MAIALSQSTTTSTTGSSNSIGGKFGSTTAAGSLIVLLAGASGVNVSSVADDKSNTYYRAVTNPGVSGVGIEELWYAYNTTAGVSIVSVTYTGAGAFRDLTLAEFTGALTAVNPLDKASFSTDTISAAHATTVLVTPEEDGALFVAAAEENTGTPGVNTPYTLIKNPGNANIMAYYVQPTKSALSADLNCTGATHWSTLLAVFRAPGAGGSVQTYYCDNPQQSSSSAGLLNLTQPGASTSTTGWTVAKTAAGNYSRQTYNTEVASGNFTTTAQPSGAPITTNGHKGEDCWRTSSATTGIFSAGTWYSSLSVIAVTSGGDQDGNARFRLWRSTDPAGASPTELTAGTMVGTTVTNLATTVAQSSSASTWLTAFSLNNEYLFLQAAWQITGVGGATTRDVLVRLGSIAQTSGSGLLTSNFSLPAVAGGGAAKAGYYLQYYLAQVEDQV